MNEQREEALWGVFLMFVVMALVMVRTGVVCRALTAVMPLQEESYDAPSDIDGPPSPIDAPPPPASSDDLYRAVVAVLSLAEIAGRLLIVKTREVWELMNEPLAGLAHERRLNIASLCERQVPLLDTS